MKVTIGKLRTLIREEYLRGVPEYALRDSTHKFTEDIRKHINVFLSMTRESPEDRREALALADQVLKELEEEVYLKLEEALWQFIQKV